MSWQSRTELMFGVERVQQLRQAHVMVVGLGGVGAYAVEMLCRAGVGEFTTEKDRYRRRRNCRQRSSFYEIRRKKKLSKWLVAYKTYRNY